MHNLVRAAILVAGLSPIAWAQPVSAPPPSQSAAAGEASTYRSAFDDYRRWTDAAPQDWQRLNAEMQSLGGHAGHLRASSPRADGGSPAPKAAATGGAPPDKSR